LYKDNPAYAGDQHGQAGVSRSLLIAVNTANEVERLRYTTQWHTEL
jgi:hypothetical protein